MKYIYTPGGTVDGCWSLAFGNHLNDLIHEESNEICLFYGLSTLDRVDLDELLKRNKKNFFLEFSAGLTLIFDSIDKKIIKLKKFDLVFCGEKLLVEFLKNFGVNAVYINKVPLPLDSARFQHKTYKYKDIDVIYSGGIYAKEIFNCIKIISNFNYKYTHYGKNRVFPRFTFNPFYSFSFKKEKVLPDTLINYLSRSKAGFIFCKAYLNEDELYIISKFKDKFSKDIYEKIIKTKEIPDWKGRLFELSAMKNIMLVYKDSWNLVEDYYQPNNHFLYFKTLNELNDLIADISKNYYKYTYLTESVYKNIENYTVKDFYDDIIKYK
jgi:hypothetical protein